MMIYTCLSAFIGLPVSVSKVPSRIYILTTFLDALILVMTLIVLSSFTSPTLLDGWDDYDHHVKSVNYYNDDVQYLDDKEESRDYDEYLFYVLKILIACFFVLHFVSSIMRAISVILFLTSRKPEVEASEFQHWLYSFSLTLKRVINLPTYKYNSIEIFGVPNTYTNAQFINVCG